MKGKDKLLHGICITALTLGVGLAATNAFAVDCTTFGGTANNGDCTLPAGTYTCQDLEVPGNLLLEDGAVIDCDGQDATSTVTPCTDGSDIVIDVGGDMTDVDGSFIMANGGDGFTPGTSSGAPGTAGCDAGSITILVGGNMLSGAHLHATGGNGGQGGGGDFPSPADGAPGGSGGDGGPIAINVAGAYNQSVTGHYEVDGGVGGSGGNGDLGGDGAVGAPGGNAGSISVYSCATEIHGLNSASGGVGGAGGSGGVGDTAGASGADGGNGGVVTHESGSDLDYTNAFVSAVGGAGGGGGTPGDQGTVFGAGGDGGNGGTVNRVVCETGEITGTPAVLSVAAGQGASGVPAGSPGTPGTVNDANNAPCCPCQVVITKAVAPDDDCDGSADGAFSDSVITGDTQCVVYEICVENTGTQPLNSSGVLVSDVQLGITDLNFGTLNEAGSACMQIPVDVGAQACDADQDSSCLCTEVQGMNTAVINSAVCGVSQEDACAQEGSICDDTANVSCTDCSVDIEKTVALDNNCDGTPDGPFVDSVTQDTGECLLYQICVANTGGEALDTAGVLVDDPHLGLLDLNFGVIGVGADPVCVIIPVDDQTSTACNSDQDPDCECTEVEGTNTAAISSAICQDTGRNACDLPGSDCSDTADVACLDCSVEITKNVALDDNCDGTPDSTFAPSQTQDEGECVIYEICVTNTGPVDGGQVLNTEGVQVSDADLGLLDLDFGSLDPGVTACTQIASDTPAPACNADQDPNCLCTEVIGTNTAVVTAAVCGETGVNACDRPGSVCDDTAEVDCLSEGCLTRTPGYWGNHPWATIQFLDVQSCGITIDNVDKMTQGSAIEDVCYGGKDTQSAGYSPQQTQLIRQCTAAALNISASSYFEGDCSGYTIPAGPFAGDSITQVMALCCDQLCTSGASGPEISSSGCIEAIDMFNNSEDTFAENPDLCVFSPDDNCSAESMTCQKSTNNKWLNCRSGIGDNPVCAY